MELSGAQTDAASLEDFGKTAIGQLCRGEYRELCEWLPYALAYGREPPLAVMADLSAAVRSGDTILQHRAQYAVKYFSPNDIQLFALVECRLPTQRGDEVLVELIVLGGERKSIALEQISSTPAGET